MNLSEKVRQAGVVGAGGGGFPTHVKLIAKADTVIANGAECEPLLHKDAVIMEEHAAELVRGIQLAMEAVGAREGVIGVKGKKKHAVEAVTAASKGTNVRVQLLGDYYPAGDEYDLVYNVTGKLIPPGGIPIAVGVVVNNVETFVNIDKEAYPIVATHLTRSSLKTVFSDCSSSLLCRDECFPLQDWECQRIRTPSMTSRFRQETIAKVPIADQCRTCG